MVHIIWRGKGWIVFVVTFISSLVAELATRSVTRDDNYYSNNPYPFSISLLISAAIIFFVNKNLEAQAYNIDLSEYENNKRNNSMAHSFFFIPIKFWAFILFGVSIVNIAFHKS